MDRARAVVVGAGPGGLAAALALARRGAEPLVLDENPLVGGQIKRQPSDPVDLGSSAVSLGSHRRVQALLAEVRGANLRHWPGTQVIGVYRAARGWEVQLCRGEPVRSLRARSLLLATGAYDRVLPFPGWTLPGIIGAGALQGMLKHHGILPGRRVVLAGAGPLNLLVAAQLCAIGQPPVALVEATRLRDVAPAVRGLWRQPGLLREGQQLLTSLKRAGVPVLRGRAVARARGREQVQAVEVVPLDGDWRPQPQRPQILEADCLAVGFGLVPEVALLRQAGVSGQWQAHLGGWVPRCDERRRSDRSDLYAAGDGCGVRGAEVALLQGRLAGISMAQDLGLDRGAADRDEQARLQREIKRLVAAREPMDRANQVRSGLLDLMQDDTALCRCEEVSWGELRRWMDRGVNGAVQLKQVTRCGMGACQGRFCGPNLRSLLEWALGKQALLDDEPRHRAPVRPVPMGWLAE